MNEIDLEVGLSNHQRMILGAIRTGVKDRRVGYPCNCKTYNAKPNSAWAKWYEYGYQGLGLPVELQNKGLEI